MTLRVAAAQYPIDRPLVWQDYAAKAESWVAEAAAREARLLVFPEYGAMELAALLGEEVAADLHRQIDEMQAFLPRFLDLWGGLAKRHRVWLLAPTLPVRRDGQFRNTAHFFAPDGTCRVQEKMIMTRFENEEWGIGPGEALRVFDTDFGRVGIAICYDVEFPQLVHALAEAGAGLILAPSCTDTLAGWHRVRLSAQARALENQCFVLQSPTVGEAPWSPAVDVNIGAAAIFGPPDRFMPDNGILAEGELNAPGWVYADLDMDAMTRVRAEGQVFNWRDWDRQAGLGKVEVA
ncbi:carbon-nitrogen hydrolase family protein [Telmatospirillum sp. J64-1]|uniref:carbon-nitrogen hydrolase family protein n=1 Tax=Telmatospirillum sp. J64-1 TaxID=2502183 RepID=UPI00115E18A5|nr:carbon-nitrogen hydrolase family protein [Telmatospirillum sp. J64-1]